MNAPFQDLNNQAFRLDKIADLNFIPHMHNHPEIIYMLEGSMKVVVDDCERILHEGDAVFCFPNSIHSFATPSFSMVYILIVDIDLIADFSKTLLKHIPIEPFIPKERVHPEVLQSLRTMHAHYSRFYNMEDDANYGKLAIKGYLYVCVARLLAAIELAPAKIISDTTVSRDVIYYIMKNFSEHKLSLHSMAEDLKLNPSYLSRVFSKQIGIPYSHYVNSYRIKYAQKLLQRGDRSIHDIADESGFDDIRTFNRVFKNVAGMTPSEFKHTL